jgi:8-oxo-dGTP pyrophosphatase MutT (NUDIX family)
MLSIPERLRSVAAGDGLWVPPDAQPAATVVLERDGRVLLLRRSTTMRFAAGMHVFPGGRVEEVDTRHADPRLTDPFVACAVRETMEEVGIAIDPPLLFIDHWITPEVEAHRYDVRFYRAQVQSEGELASTEADEIWWLHPADALERYDAGLLPMLRPTVEVLRQLRDDTFPAPEDVIARMPRPRLVGERIHWDVVHAVTHEVLMADVLGPRRLESDGQVIVEERR